MEQSRKLNYMDILYLYLTSFWFRSFKEFVKELVAKPSQTFVFLQQLLQKIFSRVFFGISTFALQKSLRLRFSSAPAFPVPALDSWMFFAAEEEGRTEDPTERRKEKEREKGRVAKSQEIPSALVALGGFITVFLFSGWILSGLTDLMRYYLGNFSSLPPISMPELSPLLTSLVGKTALVVGPVFAVGILMAIVGNMVQVGFLFSLEPLKFDGSKLKLDPGTILKKVFFSRQIFVNLIKTLLRVSILLWAAYLVITTDFLRLVGVADIDLPDSLRILSMSALKLSLILSVILLLMAIPDYFYQRFEFMESIKMKKEEVKEEMREMEGDPHIKQEQRRRALELMRRNLMQNVKESNVVITNPTHFAVALRYDMDKEKAPRVMAKGEDSMALLIKRIAKDNDIKIIENKPLARALHQSVEENQEVPPQFYLVLLEIFKNIDTIQAKARSRQASA